MGEVMPKGPTKRRLSKGVLSIRCPEDLLEWVLGMATGDLTKSDAAVWAIELAKSYTEALGDVESRIRRYAVEHDMTELGVMRRALARGLEEMEREAKGRK